MSARHSAEAKAKELETRKALGPRTPRSKLGARSGATAEPRAAYLSPHRSRGGFQFRDGGH